MSLARENDSDAVHQLVRVRAHSRAMRVEDHRHLVTGDQPVHGKPLDQLVACGLERHPEQTLERRPGVDDVVTVDDEFHGRMLNWPAMMRSCSICRASVICSATP